MKKELITNKKNTSYNVYKIKEVLKINYDNECNHYYEDYQENMNYILNEIDGIFYIKNSNSRQFGNLFEQKTDLNNYVRLGDLKMYKRKYKNYFSIDIENFEIDLNNLLDNISFDTDIIESIEYENDIELKEKQKNVIYDLLNSIGLYEIKINGYSQRDRDVYYIFFDSHLIIYNEVEKHFNDLKYLFTIQGLSTRYYEILEVKIEKDGKIIDTFTKEEEIDGYLITIYGNETREEVENNIISNFGIKNIENIEKTGDFYD